MQVSNFRRPTLSPIFYIAHKHSHSNYRLHSCAKTSYKEKPFEEFGKVETREIQIKKKTPQKPGRRPNRKYVARNR